MSNQAEVKPLHKHDRALLARLRGDRWTFLRDSSWPRALELEGRGLVRSSLQVSRMTRNTVDRRLAHRLTVAGLAAKNETAAAPAPAVQSAT